MGRFRRRSCGHRNHRFCTRATHGPCLHGTSRSGHPGHQGEEFGEVESVKAVSPLYSPVDGEIVEVHSELVDDMDALGKDPFGDGWLIKVKLAEGGTLDGLLDYSSYKKQVAAIGWIGLVWQFRRRRRGCVGVAGRGWWVVIVRHAWRFHVSASARKDSARLGPNGQGSTRQVSRITRIDASSVALAGSMAVAGNRNAAARCDPGDGFRFLQLHRQDDPAPGRAPDLGPDPATVHASAQSGHAMISRTVSWPMPPGSLRMISFRTPRLLMR